MAIETYFKDIADAIRAKAGTSGLITPAQMPQAIADIPSGGSDPRRCIWYSSRNAGSGVTTFTAPLSAKITFALFLLNEASNYDVSSSLIIKHNNSAISGIQNKRYTTAMNYTLFTVDMSENDTLTIENAVSISGNCGLQVFAFVGADNTAISVVDQRSNNGDTFTTMTDNNSLYIESAQYGYYNGNNTSKIRYLYLNNSTYTSIATPNYSEYWYGGTYVFKLSEVI